MSFLEQRFTDSIRPGATGGPAYMTTIKRLRGGAEHRNALWADPLRRYTAALSAKNVDTLVEQLDFIADTQGMLNGFRLKDWSDYKSCDAAQIVSATDQQIGVGDGLTYYFRMTKRYGSTYSRRITKPVYSTVVVALDGVTIDDALWFIDTVNGTVVFLTAPAVGETVSVGFEFDVPVRFAADALELVMLVRYTGNVGSIGFNEVRVREAINTDDYDEVRAILAVYDKDDLVSMYDALYDHINIKWRDT